MKKSLLFITIVLLGLASLQAQENKDVAPLIPVIKFSDNVSVKFGGFIRAEYYLDTNKPIGAVDDLFNFFPDKESKDVNGEDINGVIRQNLSTQASRFNATFSGPDVLKAKSSAFLEYDFTGGNRINLRLRHAYLKLNWAKSEILVGKTWNPLAETIFPSVNGLNTGIPFRPFGRGDQLRFTHKLSQKVSILAATFFQTEHQSVYYSDAIGTVAASGDFNRTNPIPDLHLQLHYKTGPVYAGLTSEYKILRPAIATTGTLGKFKATETISSYALGGFVRYSKDLLTIQASSVYGQNLSELFQQGGYAVASINAETGARKYTPSNSISSWVNITYGKKVAVGVFGGYQKNLGFSENILSGPGTFLGRWQDVDHIYRISPSIKYTTGRLVLAAEFDYNIAGYGTVDHANKGKIKDVKDRTGARSLLVATWLF
jgi:hypothetical protein